ncbi:LADA_0D07910g1_1 [Lachancea dasiensis]|uniref:LADA_0D07910g1_1 n=1 Tax=Lachancea dasiensis TaxID=1072105 RepID=A0A1G4J6P2_9SACH|nr:LADA_0D07910g1_1 [Lachancea dasiensis]
MPEGIKSRSPLIKSLSSKDLRRRSGHRLGYLSGEPMPHEGNVSEPASEAEEHLLQDLDNILYKKLHLGDSSPKSSSLRGSPISLSPPRSPSDLNDKATEANALNPDAQQEEEEEEEEEEEDEFKNVDEIDGPISPSSSVGSLKELARSHLHKNHDQRISPDVDYNLPVDEDYQNQLKKRASEIENDLHFHHPSKTALQWSMQDFYGLQEELPDWFSFADYSVLPEIKTSFENSFDADKFLSDTKYAQSTVRDLASESAIQSVEMARFHSLAYICLGLFGAQESRENHIKEIRRSNLILLPYMSNLAKAFMHHATMCRDSSSHLKQYTKLHLLSGTVVFSLINVILESQEGSITEAQKNSTIIIIEETNLLEYITKYIEHWRWSSRLSMRIRNAIILLQRLLLLQFGDMEFYAKVKRYVCKKHNINAKSDRPDKLTISPLDYHAFREDVSARFPTFLPPTSNVPACFDNSNSLSQFLEIPRPKSKSTLMTNVSAPEFHIATPAPSPSSSPISQANTGSKTRKSFQTNLAYPALYPSDDELEIKSYLSERLPSLEKVANDENVPFSVLEATKIIHNSMEVKLSTKQLWHEREVFMAEERGWGPSSGMSRSTPYHYDPESSAIEAQTMARVERFYEQCLPSFSSIVYVLHQTISSNVHNRIYTQEELPSGVTEEKLSSQLEIVRSKEVALKSAASVIFLINKWFKLNHILKFEHFCVILYDHRLISTATALLNSCSDKYSDRVFGRTLQSKNSLWKACSAFNPSYSKSFEDQQAKKAEATINLRFLNTEVYVLRLLSQVTGSKTQRLKELPLSIGSLLKKLYQIFSLDIYRPILKITQELTPFKNKKWKAEHMDLISGVYLYRRLKLNDNWVTGKDIAGELNDACGQEIALRALLQFYNFAHYKSSVEFLGYHEKSDTSFFNKEAEMLTASN